MSADRSGTNGGGAAGGGAAGEGERLQKVMAAAGVASRRVSEQLIVAGRVTVNGTVVTELGRRVDPHHDLVAVDGTAVQLDPSRRYLMLNKPAGVVSSMRDEQGRPDLSRFTDPYEEPVDPDLRVDTVGFQPVESADLVLARLVGLELVSLPTRTEPTARARFRASAIIAVEKSSPVTRAPIRAQAKVSSPK